MSEQLLEPAFLFRFAAPLRWRDKLWTPQGMQLEDEYQLPPLGALGGAKQLADARGAWNDGGMVFTLRMTGKRQPPWCRDSKLDESDGLHVWIDTRATHDVHRATKFCHRFAFLPTGGGRRLDEPVADQMLINRARENARPVRPGLLQVRGEKRVDGYLVEAYIPAAALTGFDPNEHPRLGFMFAAVDRELGWQTFTVGTSFPIDEDPSLWATLELTRK